MTTPLLDRPRAPVRRSTSKAGAVPDAPLEVVVGWDATADTARSAPPPEPPPRRREFALIASIVIGGAVLAIGGADRPAPGAAVADPAAASTTTTLVGGTPSVVVPLRVDGTTPLAAGERMLVWTDGDGGLVVDLFAGAARSLPEAAEFTDPDRVIRAGGNPVGLRGGRIHVLGLAGEPRPLVDAGRIVFASDDAVVTEDRGVRRWTALPDGPGRRVDDDVIGFLGRSFVRAVDGGVVVGDTRWGLGEDVAAQDLVLLAGDASGERLVVAARDAAYVASADGDPVVVRPGDGGRITSAVLLDDGTAIIARVDRNFVGRAHLVSRDGAVTDLPGEITVHGSATRADLVTSATGSTLLFAPESLPSGGAVHVYPLTGSEVGEPVRIALAAYAAVVLL